MARNMTWIFIFSDARDFDEESPTSDVSINHATSISESCCDKNLLLYEEERSLGNWSYDVTA